MTGKFEANCLPFCEAQRHSDSPHRCGVEARFFEHKEADENGVINSGIRINMNGEEHV